MKTKLLFLFCAMFVATTNVGAQNTIATMTTIDDKVVFSVKWNGTGEIFANGTLLSNNYYTYNTITPNSEGKVVLTATEDAKLTGLNCYRNQLTELDVRNNTALTSLECYNNQLTELDISNNTALTSLLCYNNQLMELDISNNTALKELFCYDNQLTELDVRNNTVLTRLYCYNNQLTELDIRNNTALTRLYCHNNQLTELDFSNNTALIGLNCENNQLTELDVRNNTDLTRLECYNNQLSSLILSGCNKLGFVEARNQQITVSVDVGETSFTNPIYYQNPTGVEKVVINGVTYAQGEEVPIPTGETLLMFTATAIVGAFPFSGTITITGSEVANPITTMTTTANKVVLSVKWSGAGKIFANDTLLENDNYTYNTITPDNEGKVVLAATGNAKLTYLWCFYNQLTELDISNNTALTHLDCRNNQLTELDVSNNTALTRLECPYNQLTELDLSNNTALTELYCFGNQLTELDISNNTALEILYCYNNQLTELDLSNNTALEWLYCNYNQLTELDLSNNTALTGLSCYNNQLSSLNLSGCNRLEIVSAHNQQITVPAGAGETSFLNPIYYRNPTGVEKVVINGVAYAQGEEVVIPTGKTSLTFTSTAIGNSDPFSGTIVKHEETAISSTAINPVSVYSTSEGIVIKNAPTGETIQVYNIASILVQTQYTTSPETTIALPQGIYIIKIGNKSHKVIV